MILQCVEYYNDIILQVGVQNDSHNSQKKQQRLGISGVKFGKIRNTLSGHASYGVISV